MGTNQKQTEETVIEYITDFSGVGFEFIQDQFVISIFRDDKAPHKISLDLSDDEFQQLDMVVFRKRMNRFVGLGVNNG